jgi:predicted DNA-binding protein with PD1-like motif
MQGIAMDFKRMHFLRIDPGEEVIAAIEKYATAQNIQAVSLTLIGANGT